MNALEILRHVLVTSGVSIVDVEALTSVHAEASYGIVDIIDQAVGGLDFDTPPRALAKQMQKAVLHKIVFDNVIFAGVLTTRGAKAGVRPFTAFLQEAGFTTPFVYVSNGTQCPAYRTANWQFVMTYENHLGVGRIGRVVIVELATSRRKIPGMTVRVMRKLLSQFAENVPNERGVTGAQKRASGIGGKVAVVHEVADAITDSQVDEIEDPIDTDKARGQRFKSFQDLAAALL
jgi:hypothetical protein